MGALQAAVRRLKAWTELVQSKAFIRELLLTLTAWAALFVIGIWMVICQQWSDMRWIKRLEENKLYSGSDDEKTTKWPVQVMLQDQVLEALPLLKQAWISDKLVGTSVIFCILGCSYLAAGWRQRMMLIRRIAWMVGILYFIRSVTLSVTTLPPSIDTCEITVPQSMWQVIKATPDILAGNIGQCTDKIFSGHTSILVISTLFWLRYSTHWGFILYSMIHCSLGIISVLLARYHYTVDVVIGFFLTYFIHQMYYTALDQAIRQRDICRGNRMAWRKIRNSSVYSHHHRHHEEDSEEFGSHGVYKMTVLARNQDGNAEDSLWRDYDSAVGVDISGRVTPHRPQNPNADDPSFVVRKRETSTATTALSVSSEAANDPMDVSLIAPASLAAPSGISEIGEHCEIPMDQIDRGSGGQQNDVSEENEPFTDDDEDDGLEGLPFVESIRVQSTSPHRLDIMGINRSFGSFLPAIVAWMDGLDIRYK